MATRNEIVKDKEEIVFDVEEYLNELDEEIEYIEICNKNITFLPNLQRFTKLKDLTCHSNKLKSLTPDDETLLPETLTVLNCAGNNLTKFPKVLPPNLIELYCDDNDFQLINCELPKMLQIFDCSQNKFKNINCKLPSNLIAFICSFNELQYLPELPEKLEELDCSHNELLLWLPTLPKTLLTLDCSWNELKWIINEDEMNVTRIMPPNLTTLNITFNELENLPKLPNTIINMFSITGNIKLEEIYPCLKNKGLRDKEIYTVEHEIKYINKRNRFLNRKW